MKIIGVSGIARSGKDTIADCLAERIRDNFPNLTVQRESLASFLRQEMADFFMDKFGKDIYTLTGEEKEIFRPLLVAYGYARRMETKGTYFTSKMQKKMNTEKADVYILSDVRYADHEADELFWLRKNKGKLIHIKRYDEVKGKKKFIKAPNDDERRNDPILEKSADFNIIWSSAASPEQLKIEAKQNCEKFILENINFFL